MDNFLYYLDRCLGLAVLEACDFHLCHHKDYILKGTQGIAVQHLGKINLSGQSSILRIKPKMGESNL